MAQEVDAIESKIASKNQDLGDLEIQVQKNEAERIKAQEDFSQLNDKYTAIVEQMKLNDQQMD